MRRCVDLASQCQLPIWARRWASTSSASVDIIVTSAAPAIAAITNARSGTPIVFAAATEMPRDYQFSAHTASICCIAMGPHGRRPLWDQLQSSSPSSSRLKSASAKPPIPGMTVIDRSTYA